MPDKPQSKPNPQTSQNNEMSTIVEVIRKEPLSVESLLQSIEEMSAEDIQKLLPQLYQTLEETQKQPVHKVVSEEFSKEWESYRLQMTEEFQLNLQKDKEDFSLHAATEAILNRRIGEEATKEFFRVLNICLKESNMRKFGIFYTKYQTSDHIRDVARVALTVFRLKKIEITGEKVFGNRNSVRDNLRELSKMGSQSIDQTIQDFTEVGILS